MKRGLACAGLFAALAFVFVVADARAMHGREGSARRTADAPLLAVTLTHDPKPSVVVGQNLTFTLTVTAGAHDLSNVVLTDTMDASFTYVSGEGPDGACSSFPGLTNVVTCPMETITA